MTGSRMDLHSKILLGLAEVLADSRAKGTEDEIEKLLSKCPDVPINGGTDILTRKEAPGLGAMTRRRQQTMAALVRYAQKSSPEKKLELAPRLISYMRHLPAFDWEPVHLNISGLLEIGDACPEFYETIIDTLWAYVRFIVQMISENVEFTVTFILPSMTGFFRAVQTSPFLYRPPQLLALCKNIRNLLNDDTLDMIRVSIATCLKSDGYSLQVLNWYAEQENPLSSNRVVYDLLISFRNVLSRVLTQNSNPQPTSRFTWPCESLLMEHAIKPQTDPELHKNIKHLFVMSLGYHEDIKKFAEKSIQEQTSWSPEAYMQEIMGTSLQVAALSSIYLHEVDHVLTEHITECLFDTLKVPDSWIHIASLDAAVLIAINFAHLNQTMTDTICRFLATPSPIFDIREKGVICVQDHAIVRLSQCVQTRFESHGTQPAISTVYALLNEITRYSDSGHKPRDSIISGAPALEKLSDEQRQQVCANVLSAIVGIAVHLKDEEIISQAFSMLALRRKLLSPDAIASLTMKLVDLALVSSQSVFGEIITLLSTMWHEALYLEGNLHQSILAAQLEMAKKLKSRPELYMIYLQNILVLFIEMGNSVQRTISKSKKEDPILVSKVGSLLKVLSQLLTHHDFQPHKSPTAETVSLFRNLWFHCVLFGFVTESVWIREWHKCMLCIAQYTPVLVLESNTNYLESDLEHNSVLCNSAVADRSSTMRQKLIQCLPTLSYEIKHFSFAQIVFAQAVYHVEMMRSRMGDCSHILHYFMNDGVNNSPLGHCLETIADRVSQAFMKDASGKAQEQHLNARSQLSALLKLCCHKREKVHLVAVKTVERIVLSFPQVFTDGVLVQLLLELVQLTWLSCEAEYRDEYSPVFHFTSSLAQVTIELGDSYTYRKELCTRLYQSARKWLQMALVRSPSEISAHLQDYLSEFNKYATGTYNDVVHMGRSLALEIGKASPKNELTIDFTPSVPSVFPDESSNFLHGFRDKNIYSGEVRGMEYLMALREGLCDTDQARFMTQELERLLQDANDEREIPIEYLHKVMHRSAAYVIAIPKLNMDIVRYLVRLPVYIFTSQSIEVGTTVWNWMIVERPEIETKLMIEMANMWSWTQTQRKGLFSPSLNAKHPFSSKMTYAPSDKAIRDTNLRNAFILLSPHSTWIKFLSNRFYVIRHKSKHLVYLLVSLLEKCFKNAHLMSTHSMARYPRFSLLHLGLKVLQSTRMEALKEYKFRSSVYSAAFDWFHQPPHLALMEYKLLTDFYMTAMGDTPSLSHRVTCFHEDPQSPMNHMFLHDKTKDEVIRQHKNVHKLLLLFIESELAKLSVWSNPLNTVGGTSNFVGNTEKSMASDDSWKEMVRVAWKVSPQLAVRMNARFVQPAVRRELYQRISNNTLDVVHVPEALEILLGDQLLTSSQINLQHLHYWAPVAAITAAQYFLPAYNNHPLVLQYAMRTLEYHPVDNVFFYIPQIVQALRYDQLGYVEKYILEAGQTSQLFAHQIIWNMQANFFVDADKGCQKPDVLKPTLERIIDRLAASFKGEDRAFYEREFKFFGEVTAISGHLKEYIKFGQTEKKPLQKKRLDEELAKINVDVGVYLPSNPDGHVLDIDRQSGRPLQSHAKAPFMASFLIEKQLEGYIERRTTQIWQAAIFKVGDDCRQDVLALQLIAVFKNIFTNVGLDLYVYPYRVVATAPGRGVIDVIPRSISRDQLGREKVNSLYDYFVAKYGGPDSIAFQRARINFVQSVAAYSVISYLLQFKDRHNGNIMLDDDGITFESSPFKLTSEMIQVMGGGSEEQAFRQFSELVIKAYLASRPYAELIMQLVSLMLQSGLPCFKGETLKRMRTRFQTEKTDRAAADFMLMRIKDSFANQRTVLYDYFQKLTNGIPY
ncbi:hypothetical protein BY458DRAFT_535835 [Sporodiniella umbellata]|nr:hypothetical protein BY458DRAFT_535835 [Sporodiniella umbellata]